MLKNLLFTVCLLCYTSVFAQTSPEIFLPVKEKGKWGVINQYGKIVLQPSYEYIGLFNNLGYATAQKDGKIGVIDFKGNILLPFQYQNLQILQNQFLAFREGEKWGLMNTNGKILSTPKYDQIQINHSADADLILLKKEEKYGAMDAAGKLICEPIYDTLYPIKKHLIAVKKEQLYGVIDQNAKDIIPLEYDSLVAFANHYLIVWQQGKQGLYATDGALLLQSVYSRIRLMAGKSKKLRIEVETKQGKGLYSPEEKKMICQPIYTKINYLPLEKEYLMLHQQDGYGIVNEQGKEIVRKDSYSNIKYDKAGVFLVEKKGKWGLQGEYTFLEPGFDRISDFKQGVAIVHLKNQLGLVNLRGQLLVQPSFEKIKLKGNVARLYSSGGKLLHLELDGQGNVLDRYEVNQVKLLTVKKENTIEKEEWDFSYEKDYKWKYSDSSTYSSNFFTTDLSTGYINPNIGELNKLDQIPIGNFVWFKSEKNKWGMKNAQDSVLILPNFDFFDYLQESGLTFLYLKSDQRNNQGRIILAGIVNQESGKIIYKSFLNFNGFLNSWNVYKDFSMGNCARISHKTYLKKDGSRITHLPFLDEKGRESLQPISFASRFFGNLSLANVLGRKKKEISSEFDAPEYIEFGKWGLVNRQGEIVAKAKYDFIKNFKNSDGKYNHKYFLASRNHLQGLLDSTGKEIIAAEYKKVEYVGNPESGYFLLTKEKGRHGYIDQSGQVKIGFHYLKVSDFKEGRAAVQYENQRWGFIDQQGRAITAPVYQEVRPFSNGLAAVKIKNYWGFIDLQGELVVKDTLNKAGGFKENATWVMSKGKYGYIDPFGNYIFSLQLRAASDFSNGVAAVQDWESKKWGIINVNGKWIARANYDFIDAFDPQGYARYKKNENDLGFGLLNRQGKEILSPRYQKISHFVNGLAMAQKDRSFFLVDSTGKMIRELSEAEVSRKQITDSCQFLRLFNATTLRPFREGVAAYESEGKWGYVLPNYQVLLPARYLKVSDFYQGWGRVTDTNSGFFIDQSGKSMHLLPEGCKWKESEKLPVEIECKKGKYYLSNASGFITAHFALQSIGTFEEKLCPVSVSAHYGLADTNGTILIPAEYQSIQPIGEGIFRLEQDQKISYWHIKKGWIWQ